MARRENILFQVSWELLLRGISFTTCTYQSHQVLHWNTDGRRGKSPWISLQDADKMAATACPAGVPLWLNAVCSCWGSNQSTPLLTGSKRCLYWHLGVDLGTGLCALSRWSWASPEPATYFLCLSTIVCHNLQEFVDTTYSTPGTRCTI